jgi:hypothetical protein
MSPRRRVRWPAALVAAVLLALLGLSLAGPPRGRHASSDVNSPPKGRAPILGYDKPLRTSQELLRALDEGPTSRDPSELVQLTYASMAHAPPVEISLRDNWLLWGLGQVNPDLLMTQDPVRLATGASGICSDSAIVLLELARCAGVEARMISLEGHVLAELRTPDGWRVADPDFGILFPFDLEELASPAGLEQIRAEVTSRGHPPETLAAYLHAAATIEDNGVVEEGVLNPRLARVERIADQLQWVLPIAGLILVLVAEGRQARSV